MRNVLANSREVYHYFANKIQSSGRAGNCSYALPRAYSYAACIGQHFPQGVALSSGKWSVTTSGHQSDLRQACSALTRVYVPSPDSVSASERQVRITVARLLERASVAKSKRDQYLGEALHQVEQFNTFAAWNESPVRIDAPVTDTAALAAIAVAVKAEASRVLAIRKERAALAAMDSAEKFQAWRAGRAVNLPYGLDVVLRVKGDLIETSKGASIPVADAPKLWKLITRVMRGDRDYEIGQPVGVYQLTKIRRDGSIIVGCHDIAHSEIQAIAVQLCYEVTA